ncbi:hypothetical protein PROH_09920, partial [Prochlorothrix hollandica PCC 9006 = CALU 1027]
MIAALMGATAPGLAEETNSPDMSSILQGEQQPADQALTSLAQEPAMSTLLSLDPPEVAPTLAQATGSDQFGDSFSPSEDLQQLLNDLAPLVDTRTPRPTPGSTFGTQGKRVWNAFVRESLGCWGLGESLSDQGGHIGIIHSCSLTFLSQAPLHSGVT